ncbi:hypothetical protein B9Z19DRAFT_1088778 [Tuber borchii]|uniref:Uncharacterized protein n=1 Tax=Tuber borchii TaxID=42251 RepID=A0A2T6ZL17_TUBBO|nr:hypothetical protein B9Z19DRAFT_1088778 [Tuber borchii]
MISIYLLEIRAFHIAERSLLQSFFLASRRIICLLFLFLSILDTIPRQMYGGVPKHLSSRTIPSFPPPSLELTLGMAISIFSLSFFFHWVSEPRDMHG